MFCDRDMRHMHHHSGIAIFALASIAMTIPFIFYAKDIANSIRVIAEKRA